MSLQDLKAKPIRAVLTDLDGTLTNAGKLTRESFSALWDLSEKGYFTAIISGRPAGWADCLMRLLPLNAVVFENGAGYLFRAEDKVVTTLLATETERNKNQKVLEAAFQTLKGKFPQLKLAKDQPYRRFDYAIDYQEERPFLSATEVLEVLRYLKAQPGVTVKQSDIHLNYWVGKHTKTDAARALLSRAGLDATKAVFCGDSPNDEPLFEAFANSVGVANIAAFRGSLTHPPRFVTNGAGAAGFRELADHLLR